MNKQEHQLWEGSNKVLPVSLFSEALRCKWGNESQRTFNPAPLTMSEQNERRKANVLWTNMAVYKYSLKYLPPVKSLKSYCLTDELIHSTVKNFILKLWKCLPWKPGKCSLWKKQPLRLMRGCVIHIECMHAKVCLGIKLICVISFPTVIPKDTEFAL